MDREGEYLTLCDGARFGNLVWCDTEGSYQTENASGVSEFFFHKEKPSGDGTCFIKCKKNRGPVYCPVRAKVANSGRIYWLRGVHNHAPEFAGQPKKVYTARGYWIRTLRANPLRSPMETLLEERRRLPMEAAAQIIPTRHLRSAQLHSSASLPSKISTLDELHEAINSRVVPGYTVTEDGERLLAFRCEQSDAVVLTTRRQLACLSEAVMLQADATYQIVPRKLCRQIFTIHANWNGYTGIVASALMTSATTEAYAEIFRILKRETPGQVCQAYMGDFDAAIRGAIRAEFPGARRYGCLFHYAQALVRRASSTEVGLAKEIREPGAIFEKFLCFTALPLLPANDIRAVFHVLCQEASNITDRFDPLTAYIDSYWLTTVGPVELSVYGATCRTNNAVESHNAKLKRRLGPHGKVWNLIAAICEDAFDVTANFHCHVSGARNICSRPSRATKKNNAQIQRAWQRLEQGLITPRQFIDRVKYRAGGAANRRGLQTEEVNTAASLLAPELEPWIAEQITAHDHDYDLTPTQHMFGDHAYFSQQPTSD